MGCAVPLQGHVPVVFVLAGDFLFIRLLNLIAAFDSSVIRVVADSCLALVEGETLQVLTLRDTQMTEETYLRIVGQKTASLFSACAELGARTIKL